MTVQLDLPPDVEQQLKSRAAEEGKDVSAVVKDIVTSSLTVEGPSGPRRLSSAEFRKKLEAFANRHAGFGTRVDDSRESIYAGRGE